MRGVKHEKLSIHKFRDIRSHPKAKAMSLRKM